MLAFAWAVEGWNTGARAEPPRPLDAEMRAGEKLSSADFLLSKQLIAGMSGGYFAGRSFLFQNDNHRYFTQQTFLLYGLADDWLLRADLAFVDARNDQVDPHRLHSFGDSQFTSRNLLWQSGGLKFGVDSAVHLFAGIPDQTDYLDGMSFSIRQTGSWDMNRVRLHYNAGFYYDRTAGVIQEVPTVMESTTYGIGSHHHGLAGLRAETLWGPLYPFLEYTLKAPLNAGVSAVKAPQWVTPGLAVRLGDGVNVNLSVPIALTGTREPGVQTALPWMVQLGAAMTFDLKDARYRLGQLLDPDPSLLRLYAVDGLTGKPLSDTSIALYAGDKTLTGIGELSWTGFAETATYTASLTDYLAVTGVTALRGGQSMTHKIALSPSVGWASGQLINRAGLDHVALYLNGATTPTISGIGAFKISFIPGGYSGYATAPGAISTSVAFAVGIGQRLDLGKIEVMRPRPIVPLVVIPELPPENTPERVAAVEELIKKLNDENAKAQEVGVDDRSIEDEMATLDRDGGFELPDFANGAPIAEFQPGAWFLSAESKARLKKLAELILENAASIRYVLIQGSADDVGSIDINTMISTKRAQAVHSELAKHGVSEKLMGQKISIFVRAPDELTVEDKNAQRQVNVRVVREERP